VLGFVLLLILREPRRGAADPDLVEARPATHASLLAGIGAIFRSPMVPVLITVFIGANFVAMIFLTWMPSFLSRKFGMSLAMAGLSATVYLQIASVLGVIAGGFLADRLVRRHRGGRMMAQSFGLILGFPFIFLTGWTLSVPVLVVAMACFGFFKGLYDANIWASLYDVVPVERRATAQGFMNCLGWLGGSAAPIAIAAASARFGMSASISAGSLVYLLTGILLVFGIVRYMRGRAPATSAA
jgi:sugar phosphate permease